MKLKLPVLLNEGIKAARGLAFQAEVYALRPEIIAIGALIGLARDYVSLKPGEETEVLVPLPSLPANADIKAIRAELLVADDTSPVEPERTTVGIQRNEAPKDTYRVDTEMPSRPRNLQVKLDRGEVFWTFAGTLVKPSYELPDFSAQVNAYLDKVQAQNGQLALKFLVKSDTRGRIKIDIDEKSLDYSLLQAQTWKNSLDDTVRVDRNLQLDFCGIERLALDEISGPAGTKVSLNRIEMTVGGEFGPQRLLGSVLAHDGKEFANINSDYSLAQKVVLQMPIRCIGITGSFQVGAKAELYLEIQKDLNDFPAAGPPLAKSNLSLEAVEGDVKPGWSFAGFEAPLDLKPGTPYWIVIKGVQGAVQLGLQAQEEKYLRGVHINRGGQLWRSLARRSAPSAEALLRLVYLPEIDNQTAAVEIGIEGTEGTQRIDPVPAGQTVSFDVRNAGLGRANLVIKSHGRGTLSIANVVQEYRPV